MTGNEITNVLDHEQGEELASITNRLYAVATVPRPKSLGVFLSVEDSFRLSC